MSNGRILAAVVLIPPTPDRRWMAHLANPGAAVPWDDVRSQLGLE